MDKRIGIIGIMIEDFSKIPQVTKLISDFSDSILSRQGLNIKDHNIRIINIIVEATTDEIGAFTGKVGRLHGVRIKSILSKQEDAHGNAQTKDSK